MSACDFYKSQIFVFWEGDLPNIHLSYPKEKDDSLRPIYIFLNREKTHTVLISNLTDFFSKYGKICFYCKKQFRKSHRCSVVHTCFGCGRFLLKSNTYVTSRTKHLFCDSKISNNPRNTCCPKCNFPTKTSSCIKAHIDICNFGFRCLTCGMVQRQEGKKSNTSKIKKSHVCDSIRCKHCLKFYMAATDHLCDLQNVIIPKQFPNLAYLYFVQKCCSSDCLACIKSGKACKNHKETNPYLEPNASMLLFEKQKKENFQPVLFCDNKIKKEILLGSVREYPYFPSDIECDKEISLTALNNFGLKKKTAASFLESVRVLTGKSDKTLSEKILIYAFTNLNNYTFIIDSYFSMDFLYQAVCNNNFAQFSKVFVKGQSIRMIKFNAMNIIFLNREEFLPGDLQLLAKDFEVESFVPYYFPVQLNQDMFIKMPECLYTTLKFESFLHPDDTNAITREKQDFYNKKCFQHKKFHFFESLATFAFAMSKTLAKVCGKFLFLTFTLQTMLSEKLSGGKKIIHPFCNYISIAGFAFDLSKLHSIKNNEVKVINVKGTKIQASLQERNWSYMKRAIDIERKGNSSLITNFTSNREILFSFKEAHPDAFDETSKIAYFFNECISHGHIYQSCPIVKEYLAKCSNEQKSRRVFFLQKRMEEFERKYDSFVEKHVGIKVKFVSVIWECQANAQALKQPKIMEDLQKQNLHPLQNVSVRDSVKGAFNEVFKTNYTYFEDPSKCFYSLDVNSLYPYIAMNSFFPCGEYSIYYENELEDLVFENNNFYSFKNVKCHGVALVTVVAPSNLYRPFLLTKINGTTIGTLCKSCSAIQSTKCDHSEKDRSFVDNYTFEELNFAAKLGYKITFHQILIYQNAKKLFEKYIKLLAFFKMNYSGILDQNDIAYVENKMHFSDLNLKLDLERIKDSKSMRNVIKIILNSGLGKWALDFEKFTNSVFCKDPELLQKAFKDGVLEDFSYVSEDIVQLHLKKKTDTFSLKSNPIIFSYVTANARIFMWEQMHSLYSAGATIYFINCDMVNFSLPKNASNPLQTSRSCFGDFRNLYENSRVLSFCALSPKCYSILVQREKEVKTILKISGLTTECPVFQIISDGKSNEEINRALFEILLDRSIADKKYFYSLTQKQRRASRKENLTRIISKDFLFTFHLEKRRYYGENFETLPYGFRK